VATFCFYGRDQEMTEEKRTGKEMQSVTTRTPLVQSIKERYMDLPRERERDL
jgi:hypothetical protein